MCKENYKINMSDEKILMDIPTLQYRVAELRNLRPVFAESLEIIEKQKVRNLEATKFVIDFETVQVPDFKDPFAEPLEKEEDEAKLMEDMKKQIIMLKILDKKKSCPISKVMDRL